MIDISNSWMTNPIFLAESAHFFGAIATIMTSTRFWGKKGAIITAIIFTICAAIKEFWYDLGYELPKQTFGISLLDYAFYIIGIVVALLIVFLIKRNTKAS
jgi:hypothetical protein